MFLKTKVLACFLCLMSYQVRAQDLKQIYEQVLQADPRLLINSLGVEVGLARENQSFGALLPQVTFSANVTTNARRSEGAAVDHYLGHRYAFSLWAFAS